MKTASANPSALSGLLQSSRGPDVGWNVVVEMVGTKPAGTTLANYHMLPCVLFVPVSSIRVTIPELRNCIFVFMISSAVPDKLDGSVAPG